nr:hypothetical protein [Tanacetum cinerariifolium]
EEEKQIKEEQAASARYWKIPACCDDDDEDYDSTITPILSTEETENSLSMGDEHLDTIPATESDEVIKSSVEDLVLILSEFEGIPDTMCDVYFDNNHTPLEAKDRFEIVINSNNALKDNPTQSSEFLTKSSSTSPKSFLEETNTFHNSMPEFENFCFDLEEISSGNTTTHSDISLPDYEAFYFNDDHIEEISSGSTTTHSDISLSEYDSFILILRMISVLLPIGVTLLIRIEDDYSPLLEYVVWIFLAYLTFPVIPTYIHPFGNEDTIFDPGITIHRVYSFKPGLSHRCDAFKKFNTHRSHLNECPMIINGKNIPILDVLLFHFYPL